ncbi:MULTISPECIES: glutaminase [Nocardiopsis]|uniref:Glutaminase n=2 Tax=Nocardiopsis sinuspersici TaxID=501010 RepID=A0A7Y9XE58_9ACTN|nr:MULTISPECIES: glutaminase [Nocardiopsis]NYH53125.1 glutaminase [Nocardiopsis sinuspersici]
MTQTCDGDDYAGVLEAVMDRVRPRVGEGKVADYIPELARVDPAQFGIAVATVDGGLYVAGDAGTRFSMQSITKVFALALVMSGSGGGVWGRVHREPSGAPFNSLYQLEFEGGVPRNPMVNPGALVVTDQLLTDTGGASNALRELLCAEAGAPDLGSDEAVARSESEHGERNRALAHLMADFGTIHNPVAEVLEHYFRQCSITISCEELARVGLLLARHGRRADGSQLLSRPDARRIMAVMLTCGTYDAAGEFAYRVGLPCKSGVGGGILAVVPGRCSVAAWGPGLDAKGNSVTAALALEAFTDVTSCSIF